VDMSHQVRGTVAESVRRPPAPALRPFLDSYVGYRQAGVRRARHRGLPSPHLTLIIILDEPLMWPRIRIRDGRRASTRRSCGACIPWLPQTEGRQSGIQLARTPLGTRALLGMPADELANIDVSGADVPGVIAAQWQERLGEGDRVEHARLSWPLGGGIMPGSVREPGTDASVPAAPGTFGAYVVTDDRDTLFARAAAADAEVQQGLHETDYGSRDFRAGLIRPGLRSRPRR